MPLSDDLILLGPPDVGLQSAEEPLGKERAVTRHVDVQCRYPIDEY